MFEGTGRLDDMSTEVTVCVPTCSGSIFPLVTADTHRSPAHDLQQQSVITQGFVFILLPREVLKSARTRAPFHINGFVLSI